MKRYHNPECANPFNLRDKDIRDLQAAYAHRHDAKSPLQVKASSPRTFGLSRGGPTPHRKSPDKHDYPLAHVSILDREEKK